MRNVKAIAWIYHSLGATLCTSMFNICLLQCVIEYIYFANAKLSSRLSLCDAPPLGNRREDLQLETRPGASRKSMALQILQILLREG